MKHGLRTLVRDNPQTDVGSGALEGKNSAFSMLLPGGWCPRSFFAFLTRVKLVSDKCLQDTGRGDSLQFTNIVVKEGIVFHLFTWEIIPY